MVPAFLNQMIALFAVMFVGAIAYKKNILNDETGKKLSSLILNVTNPALILSSVLGEGSGGTLSELKTVILTALACYGSLIILGLLMPCIIRSSKRERGVYTAMTIFFNCGFMGVPVIGAVFGREYMFYGTVFVFVNHLLLYTIAYKLLSHGAENAHKQSVKEMFFNPGMIATFIAGIFFIIKPQFPSVISLTSEMLGDITAPLSMLVIGISLAKTPVKNIFTNKRLIVFSLLRFLLFPLAASFVLKALVPDYYIYAVSVLLLSMPVGAITIILANEYDLDSSLASSGILLTTLMTVITIPFIAYLTF